MSIVFAIAVSNAYVERIFSIMKKTQAKTGCLVAVRIALEYIIENACKDDLEKETKDIADQQWNNSRKSTIKRTLQQLNLNPVRTVKKCPVYFHIPWIGNVSMKFEKQITSALKRCFFSIEAHVGFMTRQLLPATKKDVLPFHHQRNVIYQFVCHCDSQYVGRMSQCIEERIKQHIPKSIAKPPTPHIHQSLPRPGKVTSSHNFTNPPSVNFFLTTPNAPYITIKTSSLFSLKLALHFISLPQKRLSSNL